MKKDPVGPLDRGVPIPEHGPGHPARYQPDLVHPPAGLVQPQEGEVQLTPDGVPFVAPRIYPKFKPPTMERGVALGPAEKAVIVEVLANTGHIWTACEAVGCAPSNVYKTRNLDDAFNDACNEAVAQYARKLHMAAEHRAVEGVLRPITGRVDKDQDGIIGYERQYSDSLLLAMLKKFDPEGYKDRQHVTHAGGTTNANVNVQAEVSLEDAMRGLSKEQRAAMRTLLNINTSEAVEHDQELTPEDLQRQQVAGSAAGDANPEPPAPPDGDQP